MANITGHTQDWQGQGHSYVVEHTRGWLCYAPDCKGASDLKKECEYEMARGGEVETALIREWTTGLLVNSEAAKYWALYIHSTGRIGIAWGADADWADAESLDEGIRVYFEDPELFESRN